MKQKIVISVNMECDKCRAKALKVAAQAYGVVSVAVEGADKDKLVVKGDGVDSVELTRSLRKKVQGATLLSVEEEKDKKDEKKEKEEKKTDEKEENSKEVTPMQWNPPYEIIVYEENPSFYSMFMW